MAKRWLIGGLAVGVGALAVAPEARTWLRRRLGLEPEDRRWFEEESAEAPEYEGDEPLDTREARFSLRARLSEEAPAEPEAQADAQEATPPRVSYVHGEVSFWRPGAADWAPAALNMPLAPGDVLYAGPAGNVEIQIGPRAGEPVSVTLLGRGVEVDDVPHD